MKEHLYRQAGVYTKRVQEKVPYISFLHGGTLLAKCLAERFSKFRRLEHRIDDGHLQINI